jgi:hypothetical protein
MPGRAPGRSFGGLPLWSAAAPAGAWGLLLLVSPGAAGGFGAALLFAALMATVFGVFVYLLVIP